MHYKELIINNLGVPPTGSLPYGLAFGSVLRSRFAALQAANAKPIHPYF